MPGDAQTSVDTNATKVRTAVIRAFNARRRMPDGHDGIVQFSGRWHVGGPRRRGSLALPGRSFCRPQRNHIGRFTKAEIGEIRPDGVGYIVRRKMRVMLFGHAGVGVAELLGDNGHRNAPHCEPRGVGMSQDVKRDRWGDPGRLARLLERTLLMRRSPDGAVVAQKNMLVGARRRVHSAKQSAPSSVRVT